MRHETENQKLDKTNLEFLNTKAGNETLKMVNMYSICPRCGQLYPSVRRENRLESFLPRTRRVFTLEVLASANIWSQALETEVELKNHCV